MGLASLKTYENLFKQLDMYGQKIELNFKKQNVFRTTFGGLLTFLIILLFGLSVWLFGKELVQRKNPAVITQERSVIGPQRIDVNKNNLILMVGIANVTSQPFVDLTIFQVRAYQELMVFYNDTVTGQKLKKVIKIDKKLKICEESDIGIPHISSYFLQMDLSKLFCFEEQELFMDGDFDADSFSQVYFSAEKCKNSTQSQIICKTPQQIEEALKTTKVQIFFSDRTVNPNDYDNPFLEKGTSAYSPTSSTISKELHLFFTNQYIESDIGILYEQIDTKHSFIYTDMKEMVSLSDPNILVKVLFRLQKSKENLMQRKYIKLADVVAQVGGLLKILVALGSLISYPFSKLYLNKAIVDEVFNFKYQSNNNPQPQSQDIKSEKSKEKEDFILNKKRPKKKSVFKQDDGTSQSLSKKDQNNIYQETRNSISSQKKKNTTIKKKQKEDQTDNNLTMNSNRQRKSILDIAKGLFQVTKNKIKFTFYDLFKHIISKNKKQSNLKHNLVQKAIQKVDNYLDFYFILNKIYEIDKIKAILLNQDQLKLFEYIPKPVIQSDQEDFQIQQQKVQNNVQNKGDEQSPTKVLKQNQVFSNFQENKSEEEKSVEAYEGLVNILKKNKRNKIDEKLVELVDPSILSQIIQKEEKTKNNQSLFDNTCQFMFIQNDDNYRFYDKEIDDQNNQKQPKSNHRQFKRDSSITLQILKTIGTQINGGLNTPSLSFQMQQSPVIVSQQEIKTLDELPNEIEMGIQSSQQAQLSEFKVKPENIFFPKSIVSQIKNSFQTLKSNDIEDQKISSQPKQIQSFDNQQYNQD